MPTTIATSLVQSKLDYCNSLYLNLPAYHITKLKVIQNNMARAVTSKRKFDRITPTLRSLHWLKIKQRIQYKIISLTYTGQPTQDLPLDFLIDATTLDENGCI